MKHVAIFLSYLWPFCFIILLNINNFNSLLIVNSRVQVKIEELAICLPSFMNR